MLSLVTPIIMEPEIIGPNGVFFLFSGLSVLATLYGIFIFKETFGMNDKEKKLIYTPERFKQVYNKSDIE